MITCETAAQCQRIAAEVGSLVPIVEGAVVGTVALVVLVRIYTLTGEEDE